MANNEVVLDIETQNTFQEAGSWDTKLLKISVVGCYFYETDEYIAYEEHELPKLWTRLEKSGRIIGYNTNGEFKASWHDVVQKSEDAYLPNVSRWAIVLFAVPNSASPYFKSTTRVKRV